MTEITYFKYGLCVKWELAWPAVGLSCRSSNICIKQDYGWFLKLSLVNSFWSGCFFYDLRLCSEVSKNLQKPIDVTAYLWTTRNGGSPIKLGNVRVSKSDETIWWERLDRVSRQKGGLEGGQFIIICIFHDLTESVAEFKTQVSTQTDIVSTAEDTTVEDSIDISADLERLSHDWRKFLEDETFSDIKLKCGDRTFSVHKSVLAARSEVFNAMFRSNMAERKTGMVHVQDLDPDVLESFLQYIYSGDEPNIYNGMARRLYEAADKYGVYALRKTCCDAMVVDLTQEDCLDVLVLADKHSDEDLKEMTSRFVAKRLRLLDTERWSTFKKEHPELAVQVYDKFLEGV